MTKCSTRPYTKQRGGEPPEPLPAPAPPPPIAEPEPMLMADAEPQLDLDGLDTPAHLRQGRLLN
ncbi:hypothetical protein SBA3_3200022 [Candidatus Sulfopaludibacter sp. SbA3]|nr:hypothetical protein SBA3_3200022 [Candidatus Sulfopaludibacter sp. SbA3]